MSGYGFAALGCRLSLAAAAAAGLPGDPGLRHPALPRVRGQCLGAPRRGVDAADRLRAAGRGRRARCCRCRGWPDGRPAACWWCCAASPGGPARRLAERLVYPGGAVSPEDLTAWRGRWTGRRSPDAPGAEARAAAVGAPGPGGRRASWAHGSAGRARPRLPDARTRAGRPSWIGWDAAPPGPRRVGRTVRQRARRGRRPARRAGQLAERERARQTQARLAELGQLAAAVAHDVRNPLNIIGMAAACADPEIRQEIRAQVDRIAQLSSDLLDYAKPWQLALRAARPRRAGPPGRGRRFPATEIGAGLDAGAAGDRLADPRRLDQALTQPARRTPMPPARRVGIEAEPTGHRPPARLRRRAGHPRRVRAQRVFEPFASRSPGGTGLGLAIVARIMAAHGGTRRGHRAARLDHLPDPVAFRRRRAH